jgi:hypothetical protein
MPGSALLAIGVSERPLVAIVLLWLAVGGALAARSTLAGPGLSRIILSVVRGAWVGFGGCACGAWAVRSLLVDDCYLSESMLY